MMNLADMLSFADIHQLNRIASHYECECNANSKNELIQSILSTINRKEVFQKAIDGLSVEDTRFLNSFLFEKRVLFSLEELVARANQTKFLTEEREQWSPRELITSFKQRGWLFNGYSQQTKYLFQFPQDLKRRFSDALGKHFLTLLTPIDEPSAYRDEQQIIVDDIYHFLHYVFHESILLTADGTMYKRYIQQILARMAVSEDLVFKAGWRFGYGRKFKEYPNRFSLIYDYCYFNKLITEHNQTLILTDLGKSKVLTSSKENITDVYHFYLKLYRNAIQNLQSLVHWIDKLAVNWVTLESLKPILCRFIRPFYYDSAESILEKRIIQMLMHLGVLTIGEDEYQGKVIRTTTVGTRLIRGTLIADTDTVDIQQDGFLS